jgi:hypothetical protein
MDKQTCIIFGNCHCSGVKKFLEFSNFYDKYEIHQFANWEMIENNELLPIKILKKANLVIYQPLSDVYNCYSTNKNNEKSFMNLLDTECKTISFPRIHNSAIYPLVHKLSNKHLLYGKVNNNFANLDELIYLYDNNKLDFDFENRMKKIYEISLNKEKDCDVKIIDFIYNNIDKQKLFLTQDHPTSIIFNEVTRQICNILDLEYDYNKANLVDENITGLQDSVYYIPSCQYPISRYSINYFTPSKI